MMLKKNIITFKKEEEEYNYNYSYFYYTTNPPYRIQ